MAGKEAKLPAKNSAEEIPGLTSSEITFVKIRRKDTTIYLECGETETVEKIKSIIARFFHGDIRIYRNGLMMDDQTSLYHQNVMNSAELFVLTKNLNEGTWETLEEVGGAEPKTAAT